MDAETPPIPVELLAVAQASPAHAELLRRLARAEPGSTVSLARLVRRLHDGTASADDERARPLPAYMRDSWPRMVRSARAVLNQNDSREACFLVWAALELPLSGDNLLAFDLVTHRDGWKNVGDGFDEPKLVLPPVIRYLRRAVWLQGQTFRAERGELSRWWLAFARQRARRRAREAVFVRRLRPDRTTASGRKAATLVEAWSESHEDGMDGRLDAQTDARAEKERREWLRSCLTREDLPERYRALLKLVLIERLEPVEAYTRPGFKRSDWTGLVQMLQLRASA